MVRYSYLGFGCVLLLAHVHSAWAQPAILPSVRVSDNDQEAIANVVEVWAENITTEEQDDSQAWDADADPDHAVAGSSTGVSVTDFQANGVVLNQAILSTSFNSSTFVPGANSISSMVGNGLRTGSSSGWADFIIESWADAHATFEVVENPEEPQIEFGELRANLYFVAIGGDTGITVSASRNKRMTAQCGNSVLVADELDGTWFVTGILQDGENDPIEVDDEFEGGINELYVGRERAEIGWQFFVQAKISDNTTSESELQISGQAGSNPLLGNTAQTDRDFDVSVWYSIH